MVWKELIHEVKTKPWYALAMVLSMSGAYLTSDSVALLRCAGFALWLVSNFIIAVGFYYYKNWFMVATYVIFEAANIRGVINNWQPLNL
jgi:hypothetical protein